MHPKSAAAFREADGGEHRIPVGELAAAFDPRFRPRIDPETGAVVRISVATDGASSQGPHQTASGVGADPFAPPAGKAWAAAQKVLRSAINRENVTGPGGASRMLAFEAARQRYTAILNSGDPRHLVALADAHGLLFYELTTLMGYRPWLMRLVLGIARRRVADGGQDSVESRKATFERNKSEIADTTRVLVPGTSMVDGKHPDTESQFVRGLIVELNNAYHMGLDDDDFGFALRFAIYAAGARGAGEAAIMESAGALAGLRRVSQVRRGKGATLSANRGSISGASLAAKRATPRKLEWGEPGQTYRTSQSEFRKIAAQKSGLSTADADGWQAHHIMPVQLRNHPVLKRIGFRFDQDPIAMLLPKRHGLDDKLSRHDGSHPLYTEALRQELNKMKSSWSISKTRRAVGKLVDRARIGIEAGRPVRNTDGSTVEEWQQWYEASQPMILRVLRNLLGKS